MSEFVDTINQHNRIFFRWLRRPMSPCRPCTDLICDNLFFIYFSIPKLTRKRGTAVRDIKFTSFLQLCPLIRCQVLRSYSVVVGVWESVEHQWIDLETENERLGVLSQCQCVHGQDWYRTLSNADSVNRQTASDMSWCSLSYMGGVITSNAGMDVLNMSHIAYRCSDACIQIDRPVQISFCFLYGRGCLGLTISVEVNSRFLS
jgi:hypothetical protein